MGEESVGNCNELKCKTSWQGVILTYRMMLKHTMHRTLLHYWVIITLENHSNQSLLEENIWQQICISL
jgi:hypothetical protein